MKYLRRRLERLEQHLIGEPILLQMPGGRVEEFPGDPNYVLDLLIRSLNGEQVSGLDLIARSLSSTEPDDAHMVDMARLLHRAIERRI
jgi:hypothetical protein